MMLAGVEPAVERMSSHSLHERGYMAAADWIFSAFKHPGKHFGSCKGMIQMQFVYPAHQRKCFW